MVGEGLAREAGTEVIEFVRGRNVPCPRCGYELRGLEKPRCPECGEELVLKVGSASSHFGWLVLAMAPGCFSGVAAVILFWPLVITITSNLDSKRGVPIPVRCAVMFGFVSAASLLLMYRARGRIMGWTTKRQAAFAAFVWGVHVLAFVAVVLALFYL